MSYVDFSALKERVPIEAAIPRLALKLTERHGQWRGPCPTCRSGGDRALVITPSKRAFYCFGARTGGDVIALVAHICDCSMKEAALFLTESVEEGKRESTSRTVPEERKKEDVRSLQPLSYVEIDHPAVRALGLDEETCQHFGAGYAPKGIMRGRVAIPIHDWSGTLIAYCGRAAKGESPALTFPNGFRPDEQIFNAHRLSQAEVTLARDPLEACLASQNGIENIVSFLTETVSAEQLQRLAALMDEKGCDRLELP